MPQVSRLSIPGQLYNTRELLHLVAHTAFRCLGTMSFTTAEEQATPLTTSLRYFPLSVNMDNTDVFTSAKPWCSLQLSGSMEESLPFSTLYPWATQTRARTSCKYRDQQTAERTRLAI
jgi:hypothetical protein